MTKSTGEFPSRHFKKYFWETQKKKKGKESLSKELHLFSPLCISKQPFQVSTFSHISQGFANSPTINLSSFKELFVSCRSFILLIITTVTWHNVSLTSKAIAGRLLTRFGVLSRCGASTSPGQPVWDGLYDMSTSSSAKVGYCHLLWVEPVTAFVSWFFFSVTWLICILPFSLYLFSVSMPLQPRCPLSLSFAREGLLPIPVLLTIIWAFPSSGKCRVSLTDLWVRAQSNHVSIVCGLHLCGPAFIDYYLCAKRWPEWFADVCFIQIYLRWYVNF